MSRVAEDVGFVAFSSTLLIVLAFFFTTLNVLLFYVLQ